MCFKLDWASLVVGSKFTVFALFYFVFEGYFPSTRPGRGDLTEGFLHYQFGGLIHGGAYFRNFTVNHLQAAHSRYKYSFVPLGCLLMETFTVVC